MKIIFLITLAELMAPSAHAADHDWKPMMTIADRKHDAQGDLLPLQSYDETIRRGMDFLLKDHLRWFNGHPSTLFDEHGKAQLPWVYYSNLQDDGTPFGKTIDRHVSYPAFHHALAIRTSLSYWRYSGNPEPTPASPGKQDP